MRTLKTRQLTTTVDYDGTQLRDHWIYEQTEIIGDCLVCFLGKADVSITHMVDAEDVKNIAPIYSPSMVHFIGEFFVNKLDIGVLYQHALMQFIHEYLMELGHTLQRRGNDLFYQERKLSVSIATQSPVSVLFHAGVNVSTQGTPIPTSGLQELSLDPKTFGEEILKRFAQEFAGWQKARCKVFPVSSLYTRSI